MVKVIIVEPNQGPKEVETDGSLKSFQELVGGYLEVIPVKMKFGIVLLANEDGLMQRLPKNRIVLGHNIVGNIVCVGSEGTEFASLTEDQIKECLEFFVKD